MIVLFVCPLAYFSVICLIASAGPEKCRLRSALKRTWEPLALLLPSAIHTWLSVLLVPWLAIVDTVFYTPGHCRLYPHGLALRLLAP